MKDVNEDLIEAAKSGDKWGLEALLSRPICDPMFKDEFGVTALMWVAWRGHSHCAELLIQVSDALAKDKDGWTALMYAADGGRTSCAELLVPVSDALAKNNNGRTASELARNNGSTPLAALIDDYSLALSEMSELGSLVALGDPRKKASLRV